MKGVKCKPSIPNMKAHLDKLYEVHKNAEMFPKTLAEAMTLHHKSYRDKGKKTKKKKNTNNSGNADETAESEEVTNGTNSGNTNNNQTGENGPTVTAHMHQEDDEVFVEALLVAARNGDNRFNMTEPDDYSLASIHSEESLGGAHFEAISDEPSVGTDENIDEKSDIPPYLEFTIEELEMNQEELLKAPTLKSEWKELDNDPHKHEDLPRKGNPENTKADFRAGSN